MWEDPENLEWPLISISHCSPLAHQTCFPPCPKSLFLLFLDFERGSNCPHVPLFFVVARPLELDPNIAPGPITNQTWEGRLPLQPHAHAHVHLKVQGIFS